MKFRSKNLLVTGGAGFIGSNFINYLLKKYNEISIYNLDLLTYAGNLDNTSNFINNPKYIFIKGDICDKTIVQNIFDKYKIDGVINFAAESHVDNSINNPEKFIRTNVNGVFNLLSCAYTNWMNKPFEIKSEYRNSRFHQISTDEVYGSVLNGSFDEESPYQPNSPYSASKASADMIVRSFNKTYGLNTSISICSNNFGKNQHKEKFIPTIIENLINNKPIPVYGNGENIRDWICVKDHCEAIDKLFNKSEIGSTYNVGGNNEISNMNLINITYNILSNFKKIDKKIEFIKDRFGHDFRYSLNTQKIKDDLNWTPQSNFKIELENYIKELL